MSGGASSSSGFLHANLIHIGFNMFVLYQLGKLLEPALGRLRFGLVYAVALFSGGLGVLLLDPNRFTVGASGAVFGLMGAAVAAFRSRGINPFATGLGRHDRHQPLFTFTIPGISIGGHVGGLIGGFIVRAPAGRRRPAVPEGPQRDPRCHGRARGRGLGAGILVA